MRKTGNQARTPLGIRSPCVYPLPWLSQTRMTKRRTRRIAWAQKKSPASR